MGNTTFYGEGMTIDTSSVFTVVTQFIEGTDGNLAEIKRFYVQNGVVFSNSESDVSGVSGNSITTDFCTSQKSAFGDTDVFSQSKFDFYTPFDLPSCSSANRSRQQSAV
jgi:cellulose 1,4-beta-cellobiosidase